MLPVAVFLVFAAIFSSATGDELRLRVALADEVDVAARRAGWSTPSRAIPGCAPRSSCPARPPRSPRRSAPAPPTLAVVLRAGGRGLDTLVGDGAAPVLVVTPPGARGGRRAS